MNRKPGLPYFISTLEEHWLAQNRRKDDVKEYREAIPTLRRHFKLERRWDKFLRICVWFASPVINPEAGSETDIPSPLPINFDLSDWNVLAEFDGTESKALVDETMNFCRAFARWRSTLLRERPLPSKARASFDQKSRDLVARLVRKNPGANDTVLHHLYDEAGGKERDTWAFKKLRQNVKLLRKPRARSPSPASMPRRRRLHPLLKKLTSSHAEHVSARSHRKFSGK